MEEKIVLKFTKEEVLSKKTNDKLDCVEVEIYASGRPDEYILYRDFKLKIPYSNTREISPEDISVDDFNRYVIGGYCLPNAYTFGLKMLLERIEERKEKK